MTAKLEHTRRVANKFIELGWKIVPIRNRKKYPEIKQWQTLDIKTADIDEYFHDDITNIGILTGPDRFVVDLDMNPWGQLDWKGKSQYPWGDQEWTDLSAKEQKDHKEPADDHERNGAVDLK